MGQPRACHQWTSMVTFVHYHSFIRMRCPAFLLASVSHPTVAVAALSGRPAKTCTQQRKWQMLGPVCLSFSRALTSEVYSKQIWCQFHTIWHAAVNQNAQAMEACHWCQHLAAQETGMTGRSNYEDWTDGFGFRFQSSQGSQLKVAKAAKLALQGEIGAERKLVPALFDFRVRSTLV